MSCKDAIFVPHVRRERELLIVGIDDGTVYHEFGVDSEFLPIDDITMWTHEFSEWTIHELTRGGHLFISISSFPAQILFRVHHLLVSLHTPSILRIEDEKGNTITRKCLTPEEFEQQIQWRNTPEQIPYTLETGIT